MASPQASSSFPAEAVRRTRTHPAPLGSTAGLSIAIACQPIKRRSTGIARSESNVRSHKKLGTYRGGRADRQQQTSSQGMEKDEQKDERGQDSARARDTWLNASAATWLRKRRHCRGVPGENLPCTRPPPSLLTSALPEDELRIAHLYPQLARDVQHFCRTAA